MTIKDTLVGLATRDEADPARDYALKMAAHYRAHVSGYGHSRFREFVFGSATRMILGRMPVPVLMAH